MNQNLIRTSSNLKMLEFAVGKLGALCDEFIFLGGCTTALFITDPGVPDVRATDDVDCIVDVLTLGQYYQIEDALRKMGFCKSLNDDVICRWRYDDLILDVMPTKEDILGFSNQWYKHAAWPLEIRDISEKEYLRNSLTLESSSLQEAEKT